MYVFVEYMTVVVLIALIATLLFAASAVVVTVKQGIATALRMSRGTISTGGRARASRARPLRVIVIPRDEIRRMPWNPASISR